MRRHAKRLAIVTVVTATAAAAAPQAGLSHHGPAKDRTGPVITVESPQHTRVYAMGETVRARYRCADRSGVALCTGTVPDGQPIPTMVPGRHHFLITAMDRRGNKRTKTVTYTVRLLPIGPV